MNSISLNELKSFEIDISLTNLVLSLVTSIICAYIVKLIYLKYAKSINNKENFSDTFILLAMTTTVVITVVKFSLALSLGLVGALSIVRFRAAIKEPEELIYLFLIIGIGLASGSNQYIISFILTLSAYLIIFLENKYTKKNITYNAEILSLEISNQDFDKVKNKLEEISNTLNFSIELKSLTKLNNKLEIIYILQNQYKKKETEQLINELNNFKIENFSFSISKDIHLPM
jgi:hypothetical protein